jgi:uncharacterized protein YkwD
MESRRGFLLGLAGLPLSLSASIPTREPLASIEQKVFQAINFQRTSFDARSLLWSDVLALTSRAHSARMLSARFFGHEDPVYGGLSVRLAAAGVSYSLCGENVFSEKNYDDPVALAVVEWMYSEGHRRNLLMPEYTHTGVGVAIHPDGTVAVTQQFLTPPPKR